MANGHVPKFGDWNNQSQPFTAVFDNARTSKRADLYGSLENSDIYTQTKPTPVIPKPEPSKPVREGKPRVPPPTETNKVRAPPARGGLYGGSGNQQQRQAPPRPAQKTQPKSNVRGGSTGRGGTTIPPFPGSVGSGDQNMSYTYIFDQVKEERRESYGGSVGNTPSRPINGQHESPAQSSSKLCCFPWGQKGSRY